MTETAFLEREQRNVSSARRMLIVRAGLAAVAVAVLSALLLPLWVAVLAGVVVGATVFTVLPRTVIPGLAAVFDAGPATELEFPRLVNVVEGLSATTGVAEPELRVIRDDSANMAAYGPPGEGVLVFTSGLLASLDRVSLEAVVAEGLARLRSRDAELGGLASVCITGPLVRNGPTRAGRPLGVASIGAHFRAARMSSIRGPQHEMLADLAAVSWTRYPPGLERALLRMKEVGTAVESATWGTAHLWIASPLRDVSAGDERAEKLNELFSMHDSIDHRSALMAEM